MRKSCTFLTRSAISADATTWGSQTIREALARKQKHFSGMDVDPDREIVVTCGGTEAMMAAMLTVCNPGDKVRLEQAQPICP